MRAKHPDKRIGLFGGSFDPPHLGHEALVHTAIEILGLDEVWVIPAGTPVHRILSGQADAEKRLQWVTEMFAGVENVSIKAWEVGRSGPVAAIDTLRRFRDACPEVVPLWLCGADSYATMESWIGYPDHRQLCSVAPFSRVGEAAIKPLAGWKSITIEQWHESCGSQIEAGHLIPLDGSLPEISASVIRDRAKHGEKLNGLVNSRICKEVEAHYGPISGEEI